MTPWGNVWDRSAAVGQVRRSLAVETVIHHRHEFVPWPGVRVSVCLTVCSGIHWPTTLWTIVQVWKMHPNTSTFYISDIRDIQVIAFRMDGPGMCMSVVVWGVNDNVGRWFSQCTWVSVMIAMHTWVSLFTCQQCIVLLDVDILCMWSSSRCVYQYPGVGDCLRGWSRWADDNAAKWSGLCGELSQGVNQDWDLSVYVWSRCMCENAARCDHVTGDCHCSPGWTGEDCSQTCRPGHWGVDCRRVNMVQLYIASQISSTRIDFGMSFTAYRDIPFLFVSLLCAQSW